MKRGRAKSVRVTRDDQLGSLAAVALYMGVGRTWLSGVKRRQGELRHEPLPVIPFVGGKTCAEWIKRFIQLPINAAFVPTAGYKKAPPSPHQGREASTSGKSDSPPRQHAR